MPKYVKNDESGLNVKATKEFTDREEPRKVFWDKYQELETNIKNKSENIPISVISYYGFGGIGKSTLLLKIDEEIKKKRPDTIVEFIDFEKIVELNNNLLEILKVIRQDLKHKYNFTFPIFDLVVYVYETKLGKEASRPALTSILEENKELGFLLEVAEEIPLLGTISKVISLVDKGKNIIKERFNNIKLKEKLLQLESQSIDEIKSQLQYYFALDLAENIKKQDSLFVFIIDTYEKLVNELSSVGNPLDNDLWLRGENGLILNVPNTLWVIAGREKLKWEELDKDWEDSLDQHLLGTLSFADTMSFLKTAGIENEELIHQLYDLTHGSPMYLDMCVDTYVSIINKGQKVSIENFGEDTTKLIKRFLMYMNDTERDFSTMLAYIPSWTDENIEEIARRMNCNFSFSLYEKVKNFSFVVNENGKYKINELIKDIIIANTPNSMRQKFLKVSEEETNKKIEKIIVEEDTKVKELEIKENKVVSYINNFESRTAYRGVIDNLLNEVCRSMDIEIFKSKANYLIDKIENYENRFDRPIIFENNKYLTILKEYSDTIEYTKLACYADLDIKSVIQNSNILEKKESNGLYPIKRFLRYTEENIKDIARFDEIKQRLKDEEDLYYIRLLSLAPYSFSKYDECKKEFINKLDNYKGEINTFYIELLLGTLDKGVKKNTDTVNKNQDDTYNSLDSLIERFNNLSNEINAAAVEVSADAHVYPFEKRKFIRIEKMIQAFKENPKLLTAKILSNIFELTGYDLDEETRKSLFDYLYSIRYIALNSSDSEVIDSFYNIFKDYIGGEYNSLNNGDYDEEIISKATFAIEQIRDRYIELYGEESFVANEAETYILKNEIKRNPRIFKEIMDKNIEKFGIVDYKTADTFLTITKEISNNVDKKNFSISQIEIIIQLLVEYSNKLLDSYHKELFGDGHSNLYSYLIKNIYDTLVKLYRLVENKKIKNECEIGIVNFCKKVLNFYDDKSENAGELSSVIYFFDSYKLIEEQDYVIAKIIQNGWTNPCLEDFINSYIFYFLLLDLYNEIEIKKYEEKYKDKCPHNSFAEAYFDWKKVPDDKKKFLIHLECAGMDIPNSNITRFLEARALVNLINATDIKEKYYQLARGKYKNSSTDYDLKIILRLKKLLYDIASDRPLICNTSRLHFHDLYQGYLNTICTIVGELPYKFKENKKQNSLDYDTDGMIEILSKLNDTLIKMKIRANNGKDIRFKNVKEEYEKF